MEYDFTETETVAVSHALPAQVAIGLASESGAIAASGLIAVHNEYLDTNPSICDEGFQFCQSDGDVFYALSASLSQFYLEFLSRSGLAVFEPLDR